MPIKINTTNADMTFEAGFARPEFGLFRDTSNLLQHVFHRLEPYGLRLADMKVERGAGNITDFHLLCHLFNFWMTAKVRVERIEVFCAPLATDHVERFRDAILALINAVSEHSPGLRFRAFALAIGLHGQLEGVSTREYLARFSTNVPTGPGQLTGNGCVFYYSADGARSLSSLTVDVSNQVADGLYVRMHALWDATKIDIQALPAQADEFVRQAVGSLNLDLPR